MGANAPGERKTENGERRTENGAPDKRATDGILGELWRVYPAGLTRRTRRCTKTDKGDRRFRRLEPIRGRLPPADCQIDWKLPCRPKGPNLPWLRTQRESDARGGPCVRARRTSGPGACGSMAGFARHALGKGEPRPICPIGPIRPTGEPLGTLQTCLRVQGQLEVWKLRGLEAWLSHCVPSPFVAPQGRSVLRGRGRFVPSGLHAPSSVLRGALARPFPLPGCGAGPHQERQSANQPISQSAKFWDFPGAWARVHYNMGVVVKDPCRVRAGLFRRGRTGRRRRCPRRNKARRQRRRRFGGWRWRDRASNLGRP